MRGVLVKAVAETADAAYVPPLRPWASDGGALELVWGERDHEASLAGVLEGLKGLTSHQPTVVPGAGHLMTGELAGEIRAALLRHQPTT